MARRHELLRGVDLHAHSSPSSFGRLRDDLGLAEQAAGVTRIRVTHPALALSGIGVADQTALAAAGAILAQDVDTPGPPWHSTTPEVMIHSIHAVGPARCVLATDCGPRHSPAPGEGMRIFVQLCLEQGLSETEVRTMVVDNPRLLGLG